METQNKLAEANFPQELLQYSCLPDEIIIEILLRLPVKSILKFRCVSKSWLSLISTPYFINTQIKFCVKKSKNVNLRLVIVASVAGLMGKMCSVYSLDCENSSVNVDKIDYPLKPPFGSAKFLGSCNGLICLTPMSFKLMIWNPVTGKHKEFEDSFVQCAVNCYIRYGFGYDYVNDDYKVVKIFSFPRNEGRYENKVKIYSLKYDSWKMGEVFDSGYVNAQSGMCLNGYLHWEVSHCRDSGDGDGGGGSSEIMTFDLSTEERERMLKEAAMAKTARLVKRLEHKFEISQTKKLKAEKILAKIVESWIPAGPSDDLETITEEERVMLRRVGLRMKSYLPLGIRGVFDGVIENMHLHWKHRELVKLISKEKVLAFVEETARLLEYESGGILVAIERVPKGYALIFYRGKNYRRPISLRPRNLLTKAKALKRRVALQRYEALSQHIGELETTIEQTKSKIVDFGDTSNLEVLDQFNHVSESLSEDEDSSLESGDDEEEDPEWENDDDSEYSILRTMKQDNNTSWLILYEELHCIMAMILLSHKQNLSEVFGS